MDLFISQGFANIGCDILQYLDNQSLCQSRLVCTNWARFITCERFWHRRIIKVRIFQKVFLVRTLTSLIGVQLLITCRQEKFPKLNKRVGSINRVGRKNFQNKINMQVLLIVQVFFLKSNIPVGKIYIIFDDLNNKHIQEQS